MRTGNLWGDGIYSADSAEYARRYGYCTADGCVQLLVNLILTGRALNLDQTQQPHLFSTSVDGKFIVSVQKHCRSGVEIYSLAGDEGANKEFSTSFALETFDTIMAHTQSCRIHVAAAGSSIIPVLLVTLQFARDFEVAATRIADANFYMPTTEQLALAPVVRVHRIFANLYAIQAPLPPDPSLPEHPATFGSSWDEPTASDCHSFITSVTSVPSPLSLKSAVENAVLGLISSLHPRCIWFQRMKGAVLLRALVECAEFVQQDQHGHQHSQQLIDAGRLAAITASQWLHIVADASSAPQQSLSNSARRLLASISRLARPHGGTAPSRSPNLLVVAPNSVCTDILVSRTLIDVAIAGFVVEIFNANRLSPTSLRVTSDSPCPLHTGLIPHPTRNFYGQSVLRALSSINDK